MVQRISMRSIVGAAFEQLDAGGIDSVTVRAIAGRLGVQAPALYYHVASKKALLDEMGTEVTRRVFVRLAEHPVSRSWLEDLDAYAHALRLEYLAHRDGARTFSGTLITDTAVLRAPEPWLARWVDAGVEAADAFDAVEMVTAYVTGFVIEEQERTEHAARYAPDERAARIGSDAPVVSAAGYARGDDDGRFARQLAALLRGVEMSQQTPAIASDAHARERKADG